MAERRPPLRGVELEEAVGHTLLRFYDHIEADHEVLRRVWKIHEQTGRGFGRGDACRHCGFDWPCPTIRAITGDDGGVPAVSGI